MAGCTSDLGYSDIGSETPFYADDWVYYDEGDEYFLVGLTDEEKEALKREWEWLSPEESQHIHDRWNDLSDDERSRASSMGRPGRHPAAAGTLEHGHSRP